MFGLLSPRHACSQGPDGGSRCPRRRQRGVRAGLAAVRTDRPTSGGVFKSFGRKYAAQCHFLIGLIILFSHS
jgi:hypothetical protein